MAKYEFETMTGKVVIDHDKCANCNTFICVDSCKKYNGGILELDKGKPILAISPLEAKRGGCIECLACELDCEEEGRNAIQIILPIPP